GELGEPLARRAEVGERARAVLMVLLEDRADVVERRHVGMLPDQRVHLALPLLGRLLVRDAADVLLELLVFVVVRLEPLQEVDVVGAERQVLRLVQQHHRLAAVAEPLDLLEVGIERAADHHLGVADAPLQLRGLGVPLDLERAVEPELALLDPEPEGAARPLRLGIDGAQVGGQRLLLVHGDGELGVVDVDDDVARFRWRQLRLVRLRGLLAPVLLGRAGLDAVERRPRGAQLDLETAAGAGEEVEGDRAVAGELHRRVDAADERDGVLVAAARGPPDEVDRRLPRRLERGRLVAERETGGEVLELLRVVEIPGDQEVAVAGTARGAAEAALAAREAVEHLAELEDARLESLPQLRRRREGGLRLLPPPAGDEEAAAVELVLGPLRVEHRVRRRGAGGGLDRVPRDPHLAAAHVEVGAVEGPRLDHDVLEGLLGGEDERDLAPADPEAGGLGELLRVLAFLGELLLDLVEPGLALLLALGQLLLELLLEVVAQRGRGRLLRLDPGLRRRLGLRFGFRFRLHLRLRFRFGRRVHRDLHRLRLDRRRLLGDLGLRRPARQDDGGHGEDGDGRDGAEDQEQFRAALRGPSFALWGLATDGRRRGGRGTGGAPRRRPRRRRARRLGRGRRGRGRRGRAPDRLCGRGRLDRRRQRRVHSRRFLVDRRDELRCGVAREDALVHRDGRQELGDAGALELRQDVAAGHHLRGRQRPGLDGLPGKLLVVLPPHREGPSRNEPPFYRSPR